MDVASNRLIRLVYNVLPAGYTPVPNHLAGAANAILGANDQAMVSRHSGGKLSRWAASQRKARREMAKASRRRNRSA